MNEQLAIDWAYIAPLEATVKGSESTALRARWEFGRYLCEHVPLEPRRRTDLRGPTAVQVIAAELDINETEMSRRRTFGDLCPTEQDWLHMCNQFNTWHDLIEADFGRATLPRQPRTLPPPPDLPEGEYTVVYADPPWRYDHMATPNLRAVELHYPTMTMAELADLEPPAAADAVLFLWGTNPKLAEALEIVDAWDFEYRTNLVWVKDRIGLGYYVRAQHELLLICRRGDPPLPDESTLPPSVIHAPRGQHSEKPTEVYDLIEQLYPGYSKVELFARATRDGWASWGNEVAA